MLPLSTINAMPEPEFLETFQGVYENSPWIVKQAYAHKPYASTAKLLETLRSIVSIASDEQQLDLILAHPDLGGKLAQAGQLTAESTREQSRLGLDRLDSAMFQTFTTLNRQYRDRFHFPFIICVGLLQEPGEVLTAFRTRITNSPAQERLAALEQIHLIAQLRLAKIVENITFP
jgi:OHCU decarboxylase